MRVWVVLVLLFCAFTVSTAQSKYKTTIETTF